MKQEMQEKIAALAQEQWTAKVATALLGFAAVSKMSESNFVDLVKGACAFSGVPLSGVLAFVKEAAGGEIDPEPGVIGPIIDGVVGGALTGGVGLGALGVLNERGVNMYNAGADQTFQHMREVEGQPTGLLRSVEVPPHFSGGLTALRGGTVGAIGGAAVGGIFKAIEVARKHRAWAKRHPRV